MKTISISVLLAVAIASMSFMLFKTTRSELPKAFADHFSLIPDGSAMIDGNSVSTKAFYMYHTEVSNSEYKLFLSETDLKGDLLNTAQVDTNQWRVASAYNEPYVQYYFSHPAYENYPVVNVSHEGALAYCKWIEKKINAEMASIDVSVECRLPSREEWVRAANGNFENASYSWEGGELQSDKGMPRCNYNQIGDQGIHFDEATQSYQVMPGSSPGVASHLSDNADITAPVYAYAKSALGLFNLNGNVAEMVAQKGIAVGGSWKSTGYDVRNQSVISYTHSNPLVGFRPIVVVRKM